MNDKILMIAVSGDGNKKEGLATIIIDTGNSNYKIHDIINQTDLENIDNLLMLDNNLSNTRNSVEHIVPFKEYLRNTRSYIFNENILDKFNSDNEFHLFTLFQKCEISLFITEIYHQLCIYQST